MYEVGHKKKSDIWEFHTKPTNIRSIRKPLSRCQIKAQKSYLQKQLSRILVYVVKPFFSFFAQEWQPIFQILGGCNVSFVWVTHRKNSVSRGWSWHFLTPSCDQWSMRARVQRIKNLDSFWAWENFLIFLAIEAVEFTRCECSYVLV